MKKKHIMAIGALGFGLGIGLSCIAQSGVPRPSVAPAPPTTSVWDGSEYVGQVDDKYYYLESNAQPSPTWVALDPTRQQRFEAYTNSAGYNPSEQTNQTRNTRSRGAAMGLNSSEQPSQIQNTGSNPNVTNQIRNTRYQGHDMGQTRPVAPPLHTQ